MRYPVYFFLLLTGFFYLTGQPMDDSEDVALRNVEGKAQELKYAKETKKNVLPSADHLEKRLKDNDTPVKLARIENPPAPIATKEDAGNGKEVAASVAAPAKAVVPAKAARPKPAEKILKAESFRTDQPADSNKKTLSPATVSSERINRFGTDKPKPYRTAARKPLDWTIFGNGRKTVAIDEVKRRSPSRDELDANARSLVIASRRSFRSAGLKSRSTTRKKAKRRLVRKTRKARSSRKRYSKRQRYSKKRRARLKHRYKRKRSARLRRANARVYRLARKARKKSRRKKYAYYKPRRKKSFGFVVVGGSTQLVGF